MESNSPHVDDDSLTSSSSSSSLEVSDDDASQSPSNSTQEGVLHMVFLPLIQQFIILTACSEAPSRWEKLVYDIDGKGNWKSVTARKHKAKASTIEKKGKKQAQGKQAPAFLQECS